MAHPGNLHIRISNHYLFQRFLNVTIAVHVCIFGLISSKTLRIDNKHFSFSHVIIRLLDTVSACKMLHKGHICLGLEAGGQDILLPPPPSNIFRVELTQIPLNFGCISRKDILKHCQIRNCDLRVGTYDYRYLNFWKGFYGLFNNDVKF